MPWNAAQPRVSGELWELVARQHGVVSRAQLMEHGLSARAVQHKVATGRLHLVARGIYAAGRPDLSHEGAWTAALLSCGPEAVLSHRSAAALWGIHWPEGSSITVTVPPAVRRRRPGIAIHRTTLGKADIARRHGLRTTAPARTLLDLARVLQRPQLEAAINVADQHDLVDPESLRSQLDGYAGVAGVAALRDVLDRRAFVLTDSELERRFLPIARRAGLPLPETGVRLNGFKVDFYWPDLGLVVETDGLRYHRTPSQQARDRLRDQAHTAAGLTPLRFTYAQVRYEPGYVRATLVRVARRIS
jgi:hypothetical protein